MLASYCPLSSVMFTQEYQQQGPVQEDAVPPFSRESRGQALSTPPVVCELCHKGFRCKEDLFRHCGVVHGDYVEYRKHVFWKAQKHGLHPLQWWHKRAMLSAHAFFHRFSIPNGINDYCKNIDKAVPRRMEACAICAVKDWIENRQEIYLFAKPTGRQHISSTLASGGTNIESHYEDEEVDGVQEVLATDKAFNYTKEDCLGRQ